MDVAFREENAVTFLVKISTEDT